MRLAPPTTIRTTLAASAWAAPGAIGVASAMASIATAGVFLAALDVASTQYPSAIPLLYLATVLAAAAFSPVRYPDTAAAYRVMVGGVAMTSGLFGLVHPPSYDLSHVAAPAYWDTFLSLGYYGSLAGAMLALWRPSFGIVPAAYIHLHTLAGNHITGIFSSSLDYMPAAQTGLFLGVGIIAAFCLERGMHLAGQTSSYRNEPPRLLGVVSALLVTAAVGLHFASYFHSAIAKILLDGGMTSWALANDVGNRYLVAIDNGVLPLAVWPEFASWLYLQIHAHHVAVNLVVLAAQFAAIIAVTRLPTIIFLSLVFDIFHIGIYLTSGANFWPWLALNATIACACARMRPNEFRLHHAAFGALMVASSPPLFFVARLAWYDTPANNKQYLVAELDDGTLHEVPFSFFGSKSYPVGYMSLGTPPNHFPTYTLGGVMDFAIAQEAAICRFAPEHRRAPHERPLERVESFVRQHHRHVLSGAGSRTPFGGALDHFASDRSITVAFAAVDTRRIVAYRYIVESVCVGYQDGKFTRSVDYRSERRIDVRPD